MSALKKGSPGFWTGKKRPDMVAKQGRSVMCLDDGLVFPSQSAAAEHYGLAKMSVSNVVNGKNKTAGGKVFVRVQK